MKSFIKYTFATVVGYFIIITILTIIGIVAMAGMIATEGMGAPIKEKSILRINLSGELTERETFDPLASLMGEFDANVSLEDALLALNKAAKNDNIEGVYLLAELI